jgi:hypothetical protein
MTTLDNHDQGGKRTADMTGYTDVPRPARHDGVGNALRRSFSTNGSDNIPDDFKQLLDRLD